jgi:hypothetical protein
VTLPWQHPDGELVTARLLVWTREAAVLNRHWPRRPGLTLRTYTHLMPSNSEGTRRAVDSVSALRGSEA